MEPGRGEVDDGDHLGFVAVAAGAGFGCLEQGVDSFEQAVVQVGFVPGDDAVPVVFDQGDGVLDRLQAGAFRAVAPASQVLGSVAGVLVVEGLEILPPAQGPSGGQLGRGAHQVVQLCSLCRREVRPVLEPQPAGVRELRRSGGALSGCLVVRVSGAALGQDGGGGAAVRRPPGPVR